MSVSKMVSSMLRHFDQEARQPDVSRNWDSIKPVLMRAFAHEGARDVDDGFWLRLIHDGSTKKRLEYCQDKDVNSSYCRAFQGHSGGIPTSPELMKYTPIPYDWEKYLHHRGSQWVFQSILESGIISGGKEEDKARQAVFPTPLNLFGRDPEEEMPHFDYTVLQKVPYQTRWSRNPNAENWVRLKKAKDQGLQFWQTKSFAIMACRSSPFHTHRRTKSLETEGDLGKQGRSERRLEKHHRSGSSTGKPDAIHF